MRILVSAAFILGGAALAFAASSDPAAAVRHHLQCVFDKVAKLDDGKMSLKILADAIVPLCHSEHVAAMEASNGIQGTPDVEQSHTMAAAAMARNRLKAHSP